MTTERVAFGFRLWLPERRRVEVVELHTSKPTEKGSEVRPAACGGQVKTIPIYRGHARRYRGVIDSAVHHAEAEALVAPPQLAGFTDHFDRALAAPGVPGDLKTVDAMGQLGTPRNRNLQHHAQRAGWTRYATHDLTEPATCFDRLVRGRRHGITHEGKSIQEVALARPIRPNQHGQRTERHITLGDAAVVGDTDTSHPGHGLRHHGRTDDELSGTTVMPPPPRDLRCDGVTVQSLVELC